MADGRDRCDGTRGRGQHRVPPGAGRGRRPGRAAKGAGGRLHRALRESLHRRRAWLHRRCHRTWADSERSDPRPAGGPAQGAPQESSLAWKHSLVKLLEFQAKEVLASLGIAIPPGRVARTPDEAAAACASLGPVAVKAQVPVGGRGKAGGIKLASTPDEARRAAGQIIGMDIKGYRVPLVYCEAALGIARELYLRITVDRDARATMLKLASQWRMAGA